MNSIKFEGLAELDAKLKRDASMNAIKKVVSVNGQRLEKRMKDKTLDVFVKGYSQGTLRDSIETNMKDGGLIAEVGPTVDYAIYPEVGTRFMKPEPYCEPSLNEQKRIFINDLEKLTR